MNIIKKQIALASTVVVLASTGVSCKKDYLNPNAATDAQVFTTARGMVGVATGIQRTYSLNIPLQSLSTTGLLTNELFLVNAGNASELQLSQGGASVDGTNGLLTSIWTICHKTIWEANNVIAAAQTLPDKGYSAGLVGYGTLLKAQAMGVLSMYWERVPDTAGVVNVTFIDRVANYNKAVNLITAALNNIQSNPIPANFSTDIMAGINIVNTLNALRARYALFAGNFELARTSASAVDLSVRSVYNYEPAFANPVFAGATGTNNLVQPIDSTMGLPVGLRPDLADARVPFYMAVNPTVAPRFRFVGFWTAPATAIPVYIADEMRLIQAECLLRQSTPNTADALTLINAVLRQAPSADANGIGANLAAGYTGATTTDALLTEVYRNRCIELFGSGLKLEDMRRFNRPISERKRNLLPYPFRERDNNPNTPPDPSF
ncbi:MAG: RagB/SusD family nutrient uptake outer membrane protein [Bacteroidetes bacterium]|nr:MAG: RagB/SusD family nutrient uptake outer membrane protein [Bacteroidota bacterium]